MRFLLLLLFIVLAIVSCKRPDTTINGYTPKENYYYKLLAIGDGKIKPDTSDYLWINATCYTLKDSIFWDTRHNASQSFFIRHSSFPFAKHIFTMAEGDSMQYLVPTAVFYKEFFKLPVPFFSKTDSAVKFSVKILDIISEDRFAVISDSLQASREQKENEEYAQIYNYVTQNFKHSIEYKKDAFLMVTGSTNGDSVKPGKRVSLAYKGYFLDGRLADYTPENRPFDFTLGHEGQIIEGLRLALLRLKKGEKAKIIVPSRLAFGRQGSSNGSIAPFTPLLYEVEVLDVK